LARYVLQLAIDSQLDAAHGQQRQPRLDLSGPDQVADLKLPLPEPRRLRPLQRIFYASMIHGNLPHSPAITGAEPQSSTLTNTVAALGPGRNLRALSISTPRARPNSRAGLASAPAEKHCAAQAEYSRLAAQAYSPSGAMSQARFCLGRMKKVQCRPRPIYRAICMLKRGLAADVSGREDGVVLQIFPVVGDLAA